MASQEYDLQNTSCHAFLLLKVPVPEETDNAQYDVVGADRTRVLCVIQNMHGQYTVHIIPLDHAQHSAPSKVSNKADRPNRTWMYFAARPTGSCFWFTG